MIAELITGPEYENVYLKKLLARYKFQYIMDKFEFFQEEIKIHETKCRKE